MRKTNLVWTAVAALSLSACANHASTKNTIMTTPGFMTQSENIENQRPADPITNYIQWQPEDRLQKALVIDYIQGMSAHDYLFEEPSQELFRPMLGYALAKSELAAINNISGRYGLQINFIELDSDAFGRHFAGKTTAQYRVVDRRTGEVVYDNIIRSNFMAKFPGMNEDDAQAAYSGVPVVYGATKVLAAAGVGALTEDIWNQNDKLRDFFGGDKVTEATQGEWNDFTQSLAWVSGIAAVSGPARVIWDQINPGNYISLDIYDKTYARKGAKVRNGALSNVGFASRDAGERARQLNAQILAQSVTYFLMDLAASEGTGLKQVVPCNKLNEIDGAMIDAMLAGQTVETDPCAPYTRRSRNRGLAISKP